MVISSLMTMLSFFLRDSTSIMTPSLRCLVALVRSTHANRACYAVRFNITARDERSARIANRIPRQFFEKVLAPGRAIA